MYPQYNCLNVPTWIIGPALGEGLLIDRPADVLKVWPTRKPIQRLLPAQFSPLLDQLAEEKTRNGILCTPSVNPPRKQRMSFRQRSVTYVKSFLRAFTREKRYPTCFKFRFVSSPLLTLLPSGKPSQYSIPEYLYPAKLVPDPFSG